MLIRVRSRLAAARPGERGVAEADRRVVPGPYLAWRRRSPRVSPQYRDSLSSRDTRGPESRSPVAWPPIRRVRIVRRFARASSRTATRRPVSRAGRLPTPWRNPSDLRRADPGKQERCASLKSNAAATEGAGSLGRAREAPRGQPAATRPCRDHRPPEARRKCYTGCAPPHFAQGVSGHPGICRGACRLRRQHVTCVCLARVPLMPPGRYPHYSLCSDNQGENAATIRMRKRGDDAASAERMAGWWREGKKSGVVVRGGNQLFGRRLARPGSLASRDGPAGFRVDRGWAVDQGAGEVPWRVVHSGVSMQHGRRDDRAREAGACATRSRAEHAGGADRSASGGMARALDVPPGAAGASGEAAHCTR